MAQRIGQRGTFEGQPFWTCWVCDQPMVTKRGWGFSEPPSGQRHDLLVAADGLYRSAESVTDLFPKIASKRIAELCSAVAELMQVEDRRLLGIALVLDEIATSIGAIRIDNIPAFGTEGSITDVLNEFPVQVRNDEFVTLEDVSVAPQEARADPISVSPDVAEAREIIARVIMSG